MTTATVRYAFSPRQGASSGGQYHAVISEPIAAGRYARKAGDALCRPRRAFWGLELGGAGRAGDLPAVHSARGEARRNVPA